MSIIRKEDPRAIRSKQTFKKALLSLLNEETPPHQITVQRIADRAELNRATFYLHFQDVDDLMDQMSNDFFDDLSKKLDPLAHDEIKEDREQFTLFLDHIYTNRRLISVLFEHKGSETKLFFLIRNLIEARRNKKLAQIPSNYVSIDILTSSILGVLTWWMKDGIHYSSEYIANQIALLYKRLPFE